MTSTTEKKPRAKRTAESMASEHRSISISEFFTKNAHLLGFDNPRKALLTTVKEAVDNSLDACEEAGILPDIEVSLLATKSAYRTTAPASSRRRSPPSSPSCSTGPSSTASG